MSSHDCDTWRRPDRQSWLTHICSQLVSKGVGEREDAAAYEAPPGPCQFTAEVLAIQSRQHGADELR